MRAIRIHELNRRLLLTQHLSSMAQGNDALVEVTDSCCGINAQDYREAFLSYWSRVKGFRDDLLLKELRPRGGLVRTWTVRGTMHIIPSRDYYSYARACFTRSILGWMEKQARKFRYPSQEKRVELLYEPVLARMKGLILSSDGVKKVVGERAKEVGLKPGVWAGIREMAMLGFLVNAGRAGARSVWRRADEWVMRRPRIIPDPGVARTWLLEKYVRMYGPVSRADMRYWTGFSAEETDNAFDGLKDLLEVVRVEGSTADNYIHSDASLDFSPKPPRVILVPEFDSLMMGHKDKARLMEAECYRSVFGPQGLVRATILLDGFVAATWRDRKSSSGVMVDVRSLRSLIAKERDFIEGKFQEYASYLGSPLTLRVS